MRDPPSFGGGNSFPEAVALSASGFGSLSVRSLVSSSSALPASDWPLLSSSELSVEASLSPCRPRGFGAGRSDVSCLKQ